MPFEGDPLAFYGRNIIEDYHSRLKAKLLPDTDRLHSIDISDNRLRSLPEKKVGILGAGIGGLYAALILDSLDIEYEILEASDHTGGRMCTYKFPDGGKYDYYVCCFIYPVQSTEADFLLYIGCGGHALPIPEEG